MFPAPEGTRGDLGHVGGEDGWERSGVLEEPESEGPWRRKEVEGGEKGQTQEQGAVEGGQEDGKGKKTKKRGRGKWKAEERQERKGKWVGSRKLTLWLRARLSQAPHRDHGQWEKHQTRNSE